MNYLGLSKRLATIGKFIPQSSHLADIGSDHAYLPIYLLLQEKIDYAIACEVVKGPFEAAQRQVQKYGLSDRITVRLANGLNAIEENDDINVITIAGVGGTLIRDILESGKQNQRLNGMERLILQPNISERTVRIWLEKNKYAIIAETILEENKKIYEIIVAEKKQEPVVLSEKDRMFGPFLLKDKSSILKKKWRTEKKKRELILKKLQQSNRQDKKKKIIQREINLIQEVFS